MGPAGMKSGENKHLAAHRVRQSAQSIKGEITRDARNTAASAFSASASIRVATEYANPYNEWTMPIYLRLRELRRALGLTQSELAARAGVRRATVSRLENARITSIDLTVLEKLADLLGVEPGFLLSRMPPRPPQAP